MPRPTQKQAGDFPSLVQRFFTEYLDSQRGLSVHTRASYRNTFRLLLGFLGRRHHCTIDQLSLPLLDPESVLAFLDHLEGERGNCAHTRNLRLAAIRAFVRFTFGAGCVEYIETAHRILAVPAKRTARSTPAFMTREEVNAISRAIDTRTRSGRRDLLLFTLLYNTGARIGEALQLRARDMRERVVHLHGKGRKDRDVPLWPQTARLMKRWCVENHVGADQLVFTNRWGEPLSHDGASHRLDLAVKKSCAKTPVAKWKAHHRAPLS
jgi:site-specific recombinase XerD